MGITPLNITPESSIDGSYKIHFSTDCVMAPSSGLRVPSAIRFGRPLITGPLDNTGDFSRYSTTSGQVNGGEDYVQKLETAGRSGDVQQVYDVISSHGESFDERATECALQQIASCTRDMGPEDVRERVHKNKMFQAILDMLTQGAGRWSSRGLVHVMHLLGEVGYQDQLVIDMISVNLVRDMNTLDGEHLRMLASGLSTLDHSPGVILLDGIADRLNSLGSEVPDQQRVQIGRALEKLGYKEGEHKSLGDMQQEQSGREHHVDTA